MRADIRDDFNIESFYGWMEEVNDNFPIPVCCDEDKDRCAICEKEDATVEVTYKRKGYTYYERLCDECYNHPDYKEMMLRFMEEIISIKLI